VFHDADPIIVVLRRAIIIQPRIARSLALLIDQVNVTPPQMPGDTRPIAYQFTVNPAI